MKLRMLWVLLSVAMGAFAAPSEMATLPVQPLTEQSQAARLAAELLTHYHYKAVPLDDAMSEKIFDRYLKSLDGEKYFFIQADIDQLQAARTRLDDAIIKQNLSLPFAIFNFYRQRVVERLTYARTLLKEGFDFRQKERFRYEREKEAWPQTEQQMQDLWRMRVKNDWLRLRLAGQSDERIVEVLDKRYENYIRRITRSNSEDTFQVFMNAYTMAIEPHTNYLSSRSAEDFDISMRLSLVGIGAALAMKDDYTIIRELIPGGPAQLSDQLKVGDRIVGVAQGEKGRMTDIIGWRLDDTVAQIRGAAGSVVVLDILPVDAGPDGKHRRVLLTRKKVSLELQAAKKSVISVVDGALTRRIGVISLPAFYEDFAAREKGDPNFKSAARDVARLLDELKVEKVDSVLIDLRDNGGGSLTEAIELTGLFIGSGPVVQQRNAKGMVSVSKATNVAAAWDGPMGVLINRSSASASEIFAAAIQDYGRGLVIGERSFGKGTVQTMVNLDEIAKNKSPVFGELKLTIAQFFRIDGGTTQLRGVEPEISLPSFADTDSFGESSFDNALPWVKIKAADYALRGNSKANLLILQKRHEARIKSVMDLQFLKDDVAEINAQRKKNSVSLNEAERRQERDAAESKLALREKLRNATKSIQQEVTGEKANAQAKPLTQDDGLQADERKLSSELSAESKRKNAKDVLLEEAAHILSDEAGLLKPEARVETRNKSQTAIIPTQKLRPVQAVTKDM
ncbi:MAG: carboxy terminal-processing peptidase [Betaproteobacteria bacterium]